MPVLYLGLVVFGPREVFDNDAETAIFLLYVGPLWLLFLAALLLEIYRRKVTGQLKLSGMLFWVSLGGVLVPTFGLLISPVAVELFSTSGLYLVLSGLGCGLIGGFGASKLLRRVK